MDFEYANSSKLPITVRNIIARDFVISDARPILNRAPSFQPMHNLLRSQHLPKREPKSPQPRLMLFLIRTPARILHDPYLMAAIERASGRRIAAAIRYKAMDDHSPNRVPLQPITQIRIDQGIIGTLPDAMVVLCYFLNLRQQLPILTLCRLPVMLGSFDQ